MRLEKQIKSIEIVEVDEQFYFKVSAAAKYIGLSPNTLRKYTDLGLIKAKRLPISGDRSYRKDWLDEFIENIEDGSYVTNGGLMATAQPGYVLTGLRRNSCWIESTSRLQMALGKSSKIG